MQQDTTEITSNKIPTSSSPFRSQISSRQPLGFAILCIGGDNGIPPTVLLKPVVTVYTNRAEGCDRWLGLHNYFATDETQIEHR
ncbi:hypothetical protein CA54_47370 [Symmachiella macrocystis]|uniref:Uncharacterized protein n=1 Tax=Symmachiella macrocystis TaxID=2527985 RepID=A0A5C6BB83_9PLAN|nr:hypothetical protein CA54_47370 [Symmachiella macrocystis]